VLCLNVWMCSVCIVYCAVFACICLYICQDVCMCVHLLVTKSAVYVSDAVSTATILPVTTIDSEVDHSTS